jgi:hypothetical protein
MSYSWDIGEVSVQASVSQENCIVVGTLVLLLP